MTPQLLITLSPLGEVQAELPGANGSRRVVPVHNVDQIQRMLFAQARGEQGIGSEAEPTHAALLHWRDHKKRFDEKCPFCRADKKKTYEILTAKHGGKKAINILKELGLL